MYLELSRYFYFLFTLLFMKKFCTSILVLSVLFLTACASSAPMTEEQQAEKYGVTVERFREEKRAAARMNMGIEEHMMMIEK
jgi:hypothetical protein